MNKYNPEELHAAIKKQLVEVSRMKVCIIVLCSYLVMNKIQMVIQMLNDLDTQELDYLGNTDIMPWEINYTEDYRMDFVPGGINLFRKDRQKFKVSSIYYCDTVIDK